MRMTSGGPKLKKIRDLGKDTLERGHDEQTIFCDKGKGPIPPDTDNELSSGSSPSLSLLLTKNAWESTMTRSRKRPSPHPAFSDTISGASCKARREAGRRQYWSGQAMGNPPVLP